MRVFARNNNIFKLLSEAVSEGLLVVNRERLIVATNRKADRMFGYYREELIGKPLKMLVPDPYKKGHDKHVDEYFKNHKAHKMAVERSLYGKRKNKEQFPIEVSLNPFRIYDADYVLALVFDQTEISKRDIKIKELNDHLEKKIKTRTLELRETVAKLKKEIRRRKEAEKKIKFALQRERELNELKTKFLSLVSHEFKTPLSGILTSATLVGKYKGSEHQEKRDKHLKTIIGEVKHLNAILTDFLSIERLEKGKEIYKFTEFSLSKVVNEVVYNANMLLKSGQHINYPQNIDDVVIYQDEKIVTLIITNLLYNSVKYSPEDSDIDILIAIENDMMILNIKDQGIGIPKKDQKHIFERYFRAENALLSQGTGIGLNIIKSHIENLGGEISFISVENKGSTFTVKLPIGIKIDV
ncbi:PAS domain-containing sensor histidine kinase [Maribacter sp. HTCC2170]|uniref:PAS domain-containing sensor histidine kinase n=1 Tax=Maribacter sp. (strain HTCC2170 / KCCM 42371) TaxID=313603 RepID=UPI00006B4794|nr:PAS domain-containing sensor histidine kinase [Maribacter sp. HTCC2170]EAR01746.1 sensory transduction histidine kinase [Maribacter sp. HTCC2170]